MPARRLSTLFRSWHLRKPRPHDRHIGSQRFTSEAILFRVISNLHITGNPQGSACEHLRFILEHEPEHAGLQKRWLLNRIFESDVRRSLIDLLQKFHQVWDEIPFDASDYLACWMDPGALPAASHPWHEDFEGLNAAEQAQSQDYIARRKHLYLLNRNSARNYALVKGFEDASWVFPWDGFTFVSASAWSVVRPLLQLPDLAYLAIPAAPVDHYSDLLVDDGRSLKAFLPPQLCFSRHSLLRPDPALREGAFIDYPLLNQLGLPGPWLHPYSPHPQGDWERTSAPSALDRGGLLQGGWCYQLPPTPGSDPDESSEELSVRVIDSIRLLTRRTDMALIGLHLDPQSLRCWTAFDVDGPVPLGLAAIAANSRAIETSSLSSDPSQKSNQSFSRYRQALGYWQQLPGGETALTRDWLSRLSNPVCGDVSEFCDRARWQLMVDSVCALALDAQINANQDSRDHAHHLVRVWFLDPTTAMVPDASLARLSAVDAGRNSQEAAIDFRDLPALLDSFIVLRRLGCFSLAELQTLDDWLDAFLGWLSADSSAFLATHSGRSSCTWYHLLMLCIAAYRGRRNVACQVFDNLPGLLARQFRPDGSPYGLAIDAPLAHEQLFNLQAWIQLSVISSTLGRDLLALTLSNGFSLPTALAYARDHLPEMGSSMVSGCSPGDWLQAMLMISGLGSEAPPLPPLAEAATGLPPFWSLCRTLPGRRPTA